MELRQIAYFIEVARREHMTDAAHHLHVAQSAVSRQIVNLEEELGVSLFIREGRAVRLTPIGHIFLSHMEQVMNGIGDAVQVIEEYTDPEKGTIYIGYPSSLGTYVLPTAIAAFRSRYPDVKFEIRQHSYHDLKMAVTKGAINMALLGPVPMNDKKLSGKILFTENIVALLPVNHRLAKESQLKLSQLSKDPFVLFPKGFVLRETAESFCSNVGFSPEVSFEGEDFDTIKGLVSAGLGVSLIPEMTLTDHIPHGTVSVPVLEANVNRTIGVVVSKDRELLPTETLFYQFLNDFFGRLEKFQN